MAHDPSSGRFPALALLLSRLQGVVQATNGWMALCPAHPDNNPSLHVTAADNGKILLYCHAGCTTESVMQALDLEMSVLAGPGELPFGQTKGDAKGWADPKQAAKFCAGKAGGSIEAIYDYPNVRGVVQFKVVRIRVENGKTFRPLHQSEGRWHIGDPYRWAQIGVEGIRLPTVRLGGMRYTSEEAIAWWTAALSSVRPADTHGSSVLASQATGAP